MYLNVYRNIEIEVYNTCTCSAINIHKITTKQYMTHGVTLFEPKPTAEAAMHCAGHPGGGILLEGRLRCRSDCMSCSVCTPKDADRLHIRIYT